MPAIPYKNFTIFFLVMALAHFVSLAWLPQYIPVTKPLILASLIGFYISAEPRQNNVFLLGLIFAMLGDIFLMFDGELFFIVGLVSFLLMQACYVYVFIRDFQKPDRVSLMRIVFLTVASTILLFFLWTGLGNMKIPVIFYMVSILTMVAFAISRNNSLKGYKHVVLGALFFMISDTLLAFNKFSVAIPLASYLIMCTYMAAQYLIVTGVVSAKNIKN